MGSPTNSISSPNVNNSVVSQDVEFKKPLPPLNKKRKKKVLDEGTYLCVS